jgi:hypothetical protein
VATAIENTWEGVITHAAKMGAKFPELVAAQWQLESGSGKHFSGKWNAFGLKGHGTIASTKEFYDGEWVEIKAGFIDFPSLAASIEYLVSRWYHDWKGYKGVNHAPRREAAAKMLVSEGYATDPKYSDKLIAIMNKRVPEVMTNSFQPPISLVNAAQYFEGLSHQVDAWNWLQGKLTTEELSEFAKRYRDKPIPAFTNPLSVPYFSQRDNASGQGSRECFSSSCAMIAAFYGKVKSDDEYNTIRARFGDSTSSSAQIKTLEHLGLKPVFQQKLVLTDIEKEIKAGRPMATGWLHHGNYRTPSGSGHWSVVVGLSNGGTVHHDPYGMPDLVKGGHVSAQGGKYVTFANQYWLPRWEVKGGDGWGMLVRP